MSTESSFNDGRFDKTGYDRGIDDDTLDMDADKSPETLEREINAQRSSIGSLVDALESKLSPGQLIDQAMAFTKGNGGEFFSNLGTSIKTNPVPAVLTSIGLLWLMMGPNKSASTGFSSSASVSSSSGPSMLDSLGNKISDMAESVTDTLGNVKAKVQDKAQGLQDSASRMKDKAGHLTDTVSDKLSSAGQQMNMGSHDASHALKQQTQKVQSSFNYLLKEQPLALAAMGMALGALAGAALPITDKENQMLGQASDSLTDKAKQLATDGYNKASEIGTDLANEAKKPMADAQKDDSPDHPPAENAQASDPQPPSGQPSNNQASNATPGTPPTTHTHGLG